VCLGLFLWVSTLELDSIEQRSLNPDNLTTRLIQHVELSFISAAAVVAIAVTAGVLLTRPSMRRVAPTLTSVASIGQAIPSIGVLVILAAYYGLGAQTALVALIIYGILPVLRNTMVGLQQIDGSVVEAGRGMGMTKTAVLFRIELPLAVPVILAGVRTALILLVGTVTLVTFIGAGAMGGLIEIGIGQSRLPVLVVGSVLTAVLALFIDWLAGVAEDLLRPKGL
jgi:osmoprotectant transport system permease protein